MQLKNINVETQTKGKTFDLQIAFNSVFTPPTTIEELNRTIPMKKPKVQQPLVKNSN